MQHALNLYLPLKTPAQMPALAAALEAAQARRSSRRSRPALRALRALRARPRRLGAVGDHHLRRRPARLHHGLRRRRSATSSPSCCSSSRTRRGCPSRSSRATSSTSSRRTTSPGRRCGRPTPEPTVIDIQRTAGGDMTIDLADVQGNVLRGFGRSTAPAPLLARRGRRGRRARAFLRRLADGRGHGGAGGHRRARSGREDEQADSCLNVGITWLGLAGARRARRRARALPAGLSGRAGGPGAPEPATSRTTSGWATSATSAPEDWVIGGPGTPAVHVARVAVRARRRGPATTSAGAPREFAAHGLTELGITTPTAARPARATCTSATATASRSRASPAVPAKPVPDMQPRCRPATSCSAATTRTPSAATTLGDLPGALGDNATYGAFRIAAPGRPAASRRCWTRWAARRAASTASRSRPSSWGAGATACRSCCHRNDRTRSPQLPADELNDFDYVPARGTRALYDDTDGRALPDRRAHAPAQPARRAGHGQAAQPPASCAAACPTARSSTTARRPRRRRARADRLLHLRRPGDAVRVHAARVGQPGHRRPAALRGTREPIVGTQPRRRRAVHDPHRRRARPDRLRGLPNLVTHARQRSTACCPASAGCATSPRFDDRDGGAPCLTTPLARPAPQAPRPGRRRAGARSDAGAARLGRSSRRQRSGAGAVADRVGVRVHAARERRARTAAWSGRSAWCWPSTRDIRPDDPMPIAIASYRVAVADPEFVWQYLPKGLSTSQGIRSPSSMRSLGASTNDQGRLCNTKLQLERFIQAVALTG